MARRHSTSRRYPVFLALLCAILAGVLVLQLTTGGGGDTADGPVAKRQPPESGQEVETQPRFVMPPPETYSEVSERPLFLRSRRPLPPEAETAEEAPVAMSRAVFVLSGVILTDTQRLALLQGQNSPKIARVEEGQDYEGWTVESIQANKVVMRRGQEVSEIVLEDKANRPPPGDRRRVRQRIQPNPPPENEGDKKDDEKKD